MPTAQASPWWVAASWRSLIHESMLSFFCRGENEKIVFPGEANFAVGCGRSGEKFNEAGNKIFRLQPGEEKINML